jgi:hypothetical protein
MFSQPKRLVLTCLVFLATCTLTGIPSFGQRGWRQGEMWLKWRHDARSAYVLGYAFGFTTNHGAACNQDSKGLVPDVINTEHFVKLVTDFYTRYPEDRNLDISEVIEQLWKGLTIEEVHNHPFERHNPPKEGNTR